MFNLAVLGRGSASAYLNTLDFNKFPKIATSARTIPGEDSAVEIPATPPTQSSSSI